MRDILDKLLLTESTGVAHRKPGDVFVAADGGEIYFQSIRFVPAEGGKLDPAALADAVAVANEQYPSLVWANQPNARTGGFAIAAFETEAGQTIYFGRYFQEIKRYTTDNYWPNSGIPGYKFSSKTAAKAQAGMMPQDILTSLDDLDADSIVEQIAARFGGDHPLTLVANRINAGMPLPIAIPKPLDTSFTAFRDYFCELMHPIALQRNLVAGNAAEAEEIFLGDVGFAGCTISFGNTKTEGLSDSVFNGPQGEIVRVSSKGGPGGGAKASIKNLLDAVDDLTTSGNTKLKNRHQETISMIRAMKAAGQRNAPIVLAVQLGIINNTEAAQVNDLYTLEQKGMVNYSSALGTKYLSARLKRFYADRNTADANAASAFYHMLAAIAQRVVEHVNSKTNFSAAAADILNHRALVQVHTVAIDREHEWILKSFKATYPGTATTGVLLASKKVYYSTGIKGNFTFDVLTNGAKELPEIDDEPETTSSPVEISASTVDVNTSKSNVKASDSKKTVKTDSSSLGRSRR